MTSQELRNLRDLIGNKLLEPQKEEFKKALLEAMDGRTQVQFAADSGISRAQLSRLLKGEFTTPPSKETLEKIVDHSAGRVNMAKLKRALGLTVLTSDSEDNFEKLPYGRRNAVQAEEIRRGLIELTDKPIKYVTLEEILSTLTMLYPRDTTQFQIDKSVSVDKDESKKHKGAERASNVLLRWENTDTTVDYGCVIFYCVTTGGGVIVTDLAFDVKTLYDYKNSVALEIKDGALISPEDDINPDDFSLCYVTTLKRRNDDTFLKLLNTDVKVSDKDILESMYAVAKDDEKKVLDVLRERIREYES